MLDDIDSSIQRIERWSKSLHIIREIRSQTSDIQAGKIDHNLFGVVCLETIPAKTQDLRKGS